MAKTEVILTSNIVGLGGESDQVRVAAGYARNYLFPQGLAIPLTGSNKRRLESLKQRRAEREAHEFNTMSELAKGVGKLICVVKIKTGEDGKMFGTVTTGMIADELKHQFDISLDKRKIHIEPTIRTLGDHDVELRLHHDVTATLKIRVESSNPLPPVVAPVEAKREDRPERRGHRGDIFAPPTPKKAVSAEVEDKQPRAEKAERPAKAEKAPKAEKSGKPGKGDRDE
jgi:large subunit ribosomal protein L9